MIVVYLIYGYNVEGLRVVMIPAILGTVISVALYAFEIRDVIVYFNLVLYLITLIFLIRHGFGNFSRVKSRGKFEVGFKQIYTPQEENAVSVFYPMDKSKRNPNNKKWWLDYRDDNSFLQGMSTGRKWRENSKHSAPLKQLYMWRDIEFDVEPKG